MQPLSPGQKPDDQEGRTMEPRRRRRDREPVVAVELSPELVTRARGEFREMPGLQLTFAQACRLWGIDAETCETLLATLLLEHFLVRTLNGKFMAFPTASMTR